MYWRRLDREDKIRTIDSVSSENDGEFFSPATCEVEQARLSFYKRYRLYKITNYASLPSFSFKYLSDGTFFHHMDGTEEPIYTVNDKGELTLNEHNVLDYVDFFFSNCDGEDGEEMVVIRNTHDMPLLASMDEDAAEAILRSHKQARIDYDKDTRKYTVITDMFSDGQMIRATVVVNSSGRVKIVNQKMITSSFVAKSYEEEWAI